MTDVSWLPSAVALEDLLDLEQNWPLSRVIDWPNLRKTIVIVGAYKGRLMEYLLRLPAIHDAVHLVGYEPQEWAATQAKQRLKQAPVKQNRYTISPYALGTEYQTNIPMNEYGTDAASLVRQEQRPDHQGTVSMLDAAQELASLTPIDLLIMNIEGYEYTLLPHIESLYPKIRRIAIQFHGGFASSCDLASILANLDHAYANKFNYFFPAWGYWSNPAPFLYDDWKIGKELL